MKNVSRRTFLKLAGAGAAGLGLASNFPMLGRRMALAQSGNFFTIAVISDTQNYTDGRFQPASNGVYGLPFFMDQMNYLATNASTMNLAFVTHVGDIVQNGDGSTLVYPTSGGYPQGSPQNCEWLNAQQAMNVLAGIGVPFGLVPGNHDYDNMDYSGTNAYPPLCSTAAYWKTFWGSQSQYFKGQPWYGGASDNLGYESTGAGGKGTGEWPAAGTLCCSGMSSYQLFSANGIKFLHISLEMESGPLAMAWAQSVINQYPGYATIVTTHSYLTPPATYTAAAPTVPPALTNPAVAPAVKASYNGASYTNSTSPVGTSGGASNVWSTLISPNPQIFMVLCGHSWGSTSTLYNGVKGVSAAENIRIDNNAAGNPVYQIVSDYQGNTTLGSQGGDGWYRFMQFDFETGNIHFTTYNAFNGQNAGVTGADDVSFSQTPEFSDFSLPIPVQVSNSPAQVSVTESNLVYNRSTKLYTANLTLTNTSVNPISSEVAVYLNNLPSGVTLANQVGIYNGAPYTTVANGGLAAGASLIVPVQFSNPSNAPINFTPVAFQE